MVDDVWEQQWKCSLAVIESGEGQANRALRELAVFPGGKNLTIGRSAELVENIM